MMAAGDQVISGNFTFIETSIEGVVIVDVKSYGDDRGYFMETALISLRVASSVISCKIISRSQRVACCVDCTTRSSIPSRSWCA